MNKISILALFMAICSTLCAKTVYITSHGQVDSNDYIDKTINESKLTVLGKKHALLLGKYLVDVKKFHSEWVPYITCYRRFYG